MPYPPGTTAIFGIRIAIACAGLLCLLASARAEGPAARQSEPQSNIPTAPQVWDGHHWVPPDLSSGRTLPPKGALPRTTSARAADRFDARDYGAVCDGKFHSAQAALGIATLAELTGWTNEFGAKPYAALASYPYGTLFNLPVSLDAAPGTTTLAFSVSRKSGLVLTTTQATAAGKAVLSFTGPWGIPDGTPVTGEGLKSGTVVDQVFTSQLTITPPAAEPIAKGTPITFDVQGVGTPVKTAPLVLTVAAPVPVGSATITLSSPPGAIRSGTAIAGAGLAAQTFVRSVDGARVTVSPAATAAIPAGSTLSLEVAGLAGSTRVRIAPAALPGTFVPGSRLEVRQAGTPRGGVPIAQADLPKGIITLAQPLEADLLADTQGTLTSGFALYLQDVGGITAGMLVTGAGIPAGTYVELVNPSTQEVRLSGNVGVVAAGTDLTFSWPWLANIRAGMQVFGPGIPDGTQVESVDVRAGIVTLSAASTTPLKAATSNFAESPANRGTEITFYAPFTDAEAAALQMDSLGIIAAVKSAEQGGGTVRLPPGHCLTDQPIIVPVLSRRDNIRSNVVSIVGDGIYSSYLEPIRDFGPSGFVLSCGDPTGNMDNLRGMYSDGGTYCHGHFRDFHVRMPDSKLTPGMRPKVAGVPVMMSGIRGGPRRDMEDLFIEGFNTGIYWLADHTTLRRLWIVSNFIGIRNGEPMKVLFGDNVWDAVEIIASAWAHVSVHPQSFLNTAMLKSNFGFAPYTVWCEPGLPSPGMCMQGSTIIQPNWESTGCAAIADGNIRPTNSPDRGARRFILSVRFENFYWWGQDPRFQPQGGCKWNAYIDLQSMQGVTFDSIWPNTMAVVKGAAGLFRIDRSNNYAANTGGIRMSGDGLLNILKQYAGACQEVLAGVGGPFASTAYFTRAERRVTLEVPGTLNMRLNTLMDATATTLQAGSVMASTQNSNRTGVRLARQGEGGETSFAGIVPVAYPCPMTGRSIVVATSGTEIPVRVSKSITIGANVAVGPVPGIAIQDADKQNRAVIGRVVGSNERDPGLAYLER
ncbi:MAG: hypothetical protein B7Y12_06900 [Rhizobiales bacterium 24-66-13]|jgi:hypothetical protein|nr:MAG: hypothetical protein B7Y61_03780 [Rhizobiales bacterium 35-66-30]OYZ81591.1 MAG: hypothetical protein B7Y12_06900 [Rhizobiales bacterium 24-66-13]OZB10061.1 MAG: hypothetical protein B7X67_06475 [Rhizobiales bacterium 39-66-18]HQS47303.1 hypothetical protein [Xanthobacteraceae bacterium]